MCINDEEFDQFNQIKCDMHDDHVSKDSVGNIVKSILESRGRFGGVMGKWVFIKFFLISFFKCCLRKDE